MASLNRSQVSELKKICSSLTLPKNVFKSSVYAANHSMVDSVKKTTRDQNSANSPFATHRRVNLEPLTKTTKTRSIKLGNLAHTDMGTILDIIASGMVTGVDITTQPHPIIIAAGLLMMIRSFTKAIKIEFTEREASVYWGLIQASNKNQIASFDTIVEKTNIVRNNAGLNPLTEDEIGLALKILESINDSTEKRSKI